MITDGFGILSGCPMKSGLFLLFLWKMSYYAKIFEENLFQFSFAGENPEREAVPVSKSFYYISARCIL